MGFIGALKWIDCEMRIVRTLWCTDNGIRSINLVHFCAIGDNAELMLVMRVDESERALYQDWYGLVGVRKRFLLRRSNRYAEIGVVGSKPVGRFGGRKEYFESVLEGLK
ncbi:MAG: hypothetical protein ACYCQJ_09410 [Nitrososphaerales archaeon]